MKHSVNKLLFFFLGFFFLLSSGCKKEQSDVVLSKSMSYFIVPENADPIIKRIANQLKLQELKQPFIDEFVLLHGVPKWEYSEIKIPNINGQNSREDSAPQILGDTLVFIPLVPTQEAFVKGFINCVVNDNLLFKLFDGKKYYENGFEKDENRRLPNADDVATKIFEFDKKIYNYNFIWIKDKRLFDKWNPNSVKPEQFILDISKLYHMTTVLSWQSEECGYQPTTLDPVGGWGYEEEWCSITFEWDIDIPDGGGGGWEPVLTSGTYTPGSQGPGGGSSPQTPSGNNNPGWTLPICDIIRVSPTKINYRANCNEVTIDNQIYFELLDVDYSETSNTPCLFDIISDMQSNGTLKSLLFNLFQNDPNSATYNNKLEIKFSVPDVLNNLDGTPKVSQTTFIEDPVTNKKTFYIKINGSLITNCSKEMLATIVLHEITHVFLTLEFPFSSQYEQHESIFDKNAGILATAIGEYFTSNVSNPLPAAHASALSLNGIDDYFVIPNTSTIDQQKDQACYDKYGFTYTWAKSIGNKYFNGDLGTHCD